MQISAALYNLTEKALIESLDMKAIKVVADMLYPNYDFNKKTGFSHNLSIPRQIAAKQLISDVKKTGMFVKLIQILVEMHTTGYMGKIYPIKNLRDILVRLHDMGLIYDKEKKIFTENQNVRKTKNWGTLSEGEQYLFSFLRLDIAGNTMLLREHPDDVIQETYADFRKIVEDAVDRRNGRIWSWEGDGGLVAFYFSNKNLAATFTGMEIVNRLFQYNLTECRLGKPLGVRIAAHSGLMEYTDNEENLKRSDVIKAIMNIEANHAEPNTLTVSDMIVSVFSTNLMEQFRPVTMADNKIYYKYCLEWEQAE